MDGFFAHISSNCIKSTLVDCYIESLILILPFQIGHIPKFVRERQVLRLVLFHLFDYTFFIINALDCNILQGQFGEELLREVRITATRNQNLLVILDVEFEIVLQILKTSIPFKTFLESFKLEELLPIA